MAKDAVTFIRALGFEHVDILGFSLGGMIAQVIALEEPQLIRKLILAGTGPAGGKGIDKMMTRVFVRDVARAMFTFQIRRRFCSSPGRPRSWRSSRRDRSPVPPRLNEDRYSLA